MSDSKVRSCPKLPAPTTYHPGGVGSKFLKFYHLLRRKMVDGKAKNAVIETRSTLRCFLCGATPINFNDIDNLTTKFTTKEENLVYGRVCDLHAWLCSFDAINTLSDKLPVKQWRVQKQEDKDKVATRKKNQQAKFESELNLVVDVPMQGGVGNSNTGNTARKAFQDEEAFSRITEVDQNLIHRIHVMLIAINTDHCLNSEAGARCQFLCINSSFMLGSLSSTPVFRSAFFHSNHWSLATSTSKATASITLGRTQDFTPFRINSSASPIRVILR